jgi:4-hydroxy-3-methylbut-2-enyl diphosphate reductase
MRILVARSAGFCFGVRRAVERAEGAAAGAAAVSLGPLVHNPQEVERLGELGLRPVVETEVGTGQTVVTRSHGTLADQLARLEARGPVVDTTCPFVKVCQRRAEKMAAEGYAVLIVGDPGHPEAESIASFARRGAATRSHAPPVTVAAVAAQLENADGRSTRVRNRLAVVAQTTTRERDLSRVVAACLPLYAEVRVFNTICDATATRQREALELARTADLLIVVGGRDSANTRRLAEICAEVRETRWVETAEELAPGWVEGRRQVAVTAGASTPDRVISAVVRRLEVLGGTVQDGE